jgi:hypothetical protein
MKHLPHIVRLGGLALLLLAAGCGEGGGPNPNVEAKRLAEATQRRALFDKAGGDYARLSAEDRAAFVRLHGGDDAKARQVWDVMKHGPSAARGTSSP